MMINDIHGLFLSDGVHNLSRGSFIKVKKHLRQIEEDCIVYIRDYCMHNDSGPAFIGEKHHYYYINGENIDLEVYRFCKENNFPRWSEWTDEHKVLFKLNFGQ